jgi:ribonuclease P protein component
MAVRHIRDHRTFEDLRAHGRRVRHGALAVTYLPGRPDEGTRVAYAVGRHVGPAVRRNRVRRRLRAIVTRLPLAPGAYLVAATPEAGTASSAELQGWLDTCVRRVVHNPVNSVDKSGAGGSE